MSDFWNGTYPYMSGLERQERSPFLPLQNSTFNSRLPSQIDQDKEWLEGSSWRQQQQTGYLPAFNQVGGPSTQPHIGSSGLEDLTLTVQGQGLHSSETVNPQYLTTSYETMGSSTDIQDMTRAGLTVYEWQTTSLLEGISPGNSNHDFFDTYNGIINLCSSVEPPEHGLQSKEVEEKVEAAAEDEGEVEAHGTGEMVRKRPRDPDSDMDGEWEPEQETKDPAENRRNKGKMRAEVRRKRVKTNPRGKKQKPKYYGTGERKKTYLAAEKLKWTDEERAQKMAMFRREGPLFRGGGERAIRIRLRNWTLENFSIRDANSRPASQTRDLADVQNRAAFPLDHRPSEYLKYLREHALLDDLEVREIRRRDEEEDRRRKLKGEPALAFDSQEDEEE